MTSNTPLLVHRRARTRRIRSSIRPLVEFLDSKWLEFCAERKALRLSKCSVVPHPAETLADHEYYKFFPHVRYYSIVPQPPKSGVELSEELRKAALTRCTCEDVVIACWNYLWKELGSMFKDVVICNDGDVNNYSQKFPASLKLNRRERTSSRA